MTNNLLITTITLCIFLIGLDIILFYLRRKTYAENQTSAFLAQKLQKWVENRLRNWLSPWSNLLSRANSDPNGSTPQLATGSKAEPALNQQPTTVNTAEPVLENLAAQSAITGASVSTTSAPLAPDPTSADETIAESHDQPHPTKASAQSAENKTAHIQILADIPEGAVIRITLEFVDKQGINSFQKSLTHNTTQESIVLTNKATKPESQTIQKTEQEQDPVHFTSQKQSLSNAQRFISETYRDFVSRIANRSFQIANLDQWLLIVAIAIYALMVCLGIDRYPIYFFTDEAIHMNLASNFIRDNFQNYYHEFLPTFFTVEGWVNGTSVYLQVLPYLLFGKSVTVTRLVSAFISLLGALAASLMLKDAFKFKYYWIGILFVITTPAWFLHSRTAFEYVEVASFYSIFLYFYSRYRVGQLQSLYWAIFAGALCFYTHGLGQILMGTTGLALFVVDFRYHTHPDRRKTVLWGLLLGTILLLPFARYYLAHPTEAAEQVKRRGSYWVDGNFTLVQKFGEFFKQYTYGMNPLYWYFPNNVDLSRHIMYKYGNGLWVTLPLMLVGLVKSLKNIRQPLYRIVLIALFACPIPASVVAIGMPRMLWMTIPLALLGSIGLVTILEWVEIRFKIRSTWIASGLFILLASLSIFMLRDALVNGPTWFTDYSLYGMQYGAQQIFQDVVQTGLKEDPNRNYVVSPSWANGTEQFVSFFIPEKDQSRVRMGQPINFIKPIKENQKDLYFIATSNEYDNLVQNPEFKDIKVEQIIPLPDGKPGFYVITLSIADNIDQIIADQQRIAREPVEDKLTLNEQTLRVVHSPLGGGQLGDIFDDNPDTLAKVLEANPFIFDIYPSIPLTTNSLVVQTGALPDFTVTVELYAPGATEPVTYSETFRGLPPDPLVTLNFDRGPAKSARIYLEIKDNTSGETSQIHVRTVQFK
jgi:4-amino-4-deoxy-L-arabinose transferase-like glycosyltransferase